MDFSHKEPMRKLIGCLLFMSLLGAGASRAQDSLEGPKEKREWIVLSGGPALWKWEKDKPSPHDLAWDNFIFTAGLRWEQIQAEARPDDIKTWIIYKPGYVARGQTDGQDYIAKIEEKARKLGVTVLWFSHQNNKQDELIDYINNGQDRTKIKIINFDYFGHSNKACFMFDYSSEIDGVSTDWLHMADLKKFNRDAFDASATCKSYGCHSADGFTDKWYKATGTRMIGTKGKTDYSARNWPVPTKGAVWE